MTPPAIVVLDASVWLAAAGSATGGSSAAIEVLQDSDEFGAALSDLIFDEVVRNLRKFRPESRARFYALLAAVKPRRFIWDQSTHVPELPPFLADKDRHVVGACLSMGAAVCLTLDRRDLLTPEMRAWAAERGLRLMTPGEFLEELRAREAVAEEGLEALYHRAAQDEQAEHDAMEWIEADLGDEPA